MYFFLLVLVYYSERSNLQRKRGGKGHRELGVEKRSIDSKIVHLVVVYVEQLAIILVVLQLAHAD